MAATAATKSQVKAFISMLKKLRKDAGIETSADFAELLGIKERTLRGWMHGETKPSMEFIDLVQNNLSERQKQLELTYGAICNATAVRI